MMSDREPGWYWIRLKPAFAIVAGWEIGHWDGSLWSVMGGRLATPELPSSCMVEIDERRIERAAS